MTLGPRKWIRCTNKPTVVITEKKVPEKETKKGSMALCKDCLKGAYERFGWNYFTVKSI